MTSRTRRFSIAWALATSLLALPAQAGLPFHFSLDGFQVVPANNLGTAGECVGVVEEPLAALSLACVHDIHDAMTAEIHRGGPGQNGELLYTFATAEDPDGTWTFASDADLADLILGYLYVVVTSLERPGGELRGQIRLAMPNDAWVMYFDLAPGQVVPASGAPTSGRCVVTFEFDWQDQVYMACRHDVVGATGARIRKAARGANGPLYADLGGGSNPIIWATPRDATHFPDLIADILEGGLYVEITSLARPGGELRGQVDACIANDATLCLNRGRFRVEIGYAVGGQSGSGSAVPATPDSGMFYFFRPDNREVLIKVLNGCGVNGHYWIFFSATTNVQYFLRVTDMKTGFAHVYANPAGQLAEPVADTATFATCP